MGNPNLVFCSFGDSHKVDSWNRGQPGYDVALAYYGAAADDDESLPRARYVCRTKGYKVPNFLVAAERFPEILDYDYVLFVDDDIVISPYAVETTFELARKYELDACQPSLSAGSTASWPHTRQRDGVVLEYSNLVEIQCFCLSRRLLELSLPYLPIIETGWGLDLIFWTLLHQARERMAVLHAVSMFHGERTGGRIQARVENFTLSAQRVEIALSNALGLGRTQLLPSFELQRFETVERKPGKPYPPYLFTPGELRLFESVVRGSRRYLEYGSGKSTVLASKLADSVTSVEHSAHYVEDVGRQLDREVCFVERPPDRPYVSFDKYGGDWNALSIAHFLEKDGDLETFRSYIEGPTGPEYDVVFIDGRARIYCARYLYENQLVSENSYVLVHDYERKWYHTVEVWFEKIQVVDRMALLVPRPTAPPTRLA